MDKKIQMEIRRLEERVNSYIKFIEKDIKIFKEERKRKYFFANYRAGNISTFASLINDCLIKLEILKMVD